MPLLIPHNGRRLLPGDRLDQARIVVLDIAHARADGPAYHFLGGQGVELGSVGKPARRLQGDICQQRGVSAPPN
jgi:hypothetical protein